MLLLTGIENFMFTFLEAVARFLPNLIGGILILCIGIILSQIVKKLALTIVTFMRLDFIAKQTGAQKYIDTKVWGEIFSQILGWAVILLFLIPASEVWGLAKVSEVLKQLLFYIPSVLVAVIVGFVGLMFANLSAQMVMHGMKGVDKKSAHTFSLLAKYSITFFTILIVLDQLRVAQDLIRILFTGIVVMLSLAGGLAFGLGGKDMARDILEGLRKQSSSK